MNLTRRPESSVLLKGLIEITECTPAFDLAERCYPPLHHRPVGPRRRPWRKRTSRRAHPHARIADQCLTVFLRRGVSARSCHSYLAALRAALVTHDSLFAQCTGIQSVRSVCEQEQRCRKTGTLPVLTSHVCDGGSARSCRSLCALHNSCSILSEAAVVACLAAPLCLPSASVSASASASTYASARASSSLPLSPLTTPSLPGLLAPQTGQEDVQEQAGRAVADGFSSRRCRSRCCEPCSFLIPLNPCMPLCPLLPSPTLFTSPSLGTKSTKVPHTNLSISVTKEEGDKDDGDCDHVLYPSSHEDEKMALILASQSKG